MQRSRSRRAPCTGSRVSSSRPERKPGDRSAGGLRLSQRNASRAIAEASERSGVDASSHTFRHTAASRLIRAGLDVVIVQRQVGRSGASTTLDHYSHEFEIRAKIAATGVGAALEAQ